MHKICFTISLFHASTCFEHHELIFKRSKLYYTASGIITPVYIHIYMCVCVCMYIYIYIYNIVCCSETFMRIIGKLTSRLPKFHFNRKVSCSVRFSLILGFRLGVFFFLAEYGVSFWVSTFWVQFITDKNDLFLPFFSTIQCWTLVPERSTHM